MTPDERRLRARIAAHARWKTCPDRRAATAPARAAFMDKFEIEVDPDGVLDFEERQIRARHALAEHMARLQLRRHQCA